MCTIKEEIRVKIVYCDLLILSLVQNWTMLHAYMNLLLQFLRAYLRVSSSYAYLNSKLNTIL